MELSKSNESCFMSTYNCCSENTSMNNIEQSNFESLLLVDDIDKVSNRIEKISINQLSFIKNLEEWRNEAHEIIDKFCQSKHDEYIQRTNEEINHLKDKLNLLNSDHDDAADDYIHWVKETIQIINQQLNELQQIQSKFSPLKIDKSLIYFPSPLSNLNPYPNPLKDLFSFSSSSLSSLSTNEIVSPSSPLNFSNIICEKNNDSVFLESLKEKVKVPSDHWYCLSTNETNILITGKSDLILFDHSLKIINKKSFLQIGIKDICWSKILSRFILISPKQIYLFDEKTFSLELSSINLANHNTWERGTINETILFLSTFGENPILVEYNLCPSIHFNKKYQTSIICQQNETINDMKSNDIYLSLIIENSFNNQTRFQLHLIKSLQCISSIYIGKGWGYRCSSINYNHWIISDSYNQRIIHIHNNGNIQNINNYHTKPFNIINYTNNQIIIRTNDTLNIHQYK